MRARRAYRAKSVKQVNWELMSAGREGQAVHVGLDVGKQEVLAVVRWADGRFERPWLVKNPDEIGEFVGLLSRVNAERRLVTAMEPTGTYGDALRQGLSDASLRVERVGAKAAHDYAEIFDGVPSQHDGKDAAVVAELAALGKSVEWSYKPLRETDQELAYHVDWMDAQRRQYAMWLGRLEGLLARHWPEAARWLELPSATLLRVLKRHGGPAGLAGDGNAAAELRRWGGRYLVAEKIRGLVQSARVSMGVRQTAVDVRRMQQYAEQALAARAEIAKSQRCLQELARETPAIQAQAQSVGVATACVLWVHLGDPAEYHCGAAYRKAMGLNLVEHSSSMYQGKFADQQAGFGASASLAVPDCVAIGIQGPVQRWYQQKKSKDGNGAKRALIGVMRKLALALYEAGAKGQAFDLTRLFPGVPIARTKVLVESATR